VDTEAASAKVFAPFDSPSREEKSKSKSKSKKRK
jgi:hypothetical protein